MRDALLRLTWFALVLSAIAYIVFLVTGRFMTAEAIDLSRIVNVRDALRPGMHDLSGLIMVPRTCAELNIKTEMISSTTYALHFTTWNEPSIPCKDDETSRPFRTVIFAPAVGVEFVGTLDDVPLRFIMYPEIATST